MKVTVLIHRKQGNGGNSTNTQKTQGSGGNSTNTQKTQGNEVTVLY